jgi:hypothetical protein
MPPRLCHLARNEEHTSYIAIQNTCHLKLGHRNNDAGTELHLPIDSILS